MSAEPETLHTPAPLLYRMVAVAVLVATLIVVCFVLPAEFRVDPTGIGKATGVIRLAGPKRMTASEADAAAEAAAAEGSVEVSDGVISGGNSAEGSAAGDAAAHDAATTSALAAAGLEVPEGSVSSAGAPGSTEAAAGTSGSSGPQGTAASSPDVQGTTASASGARAVGRGPSARYYQGGYRSDFVDIPLTVAGSAERGEELEYKVHMKAGATLAYSWSVPGIANPEEFYYDFHGEAPAREKGTEGTVVEYKQATGVQSHGTLVAPFDGVFGWYLQNQSEKPVVVHLKISGFYTLVPPGEYGNDAGIEANKAAKP